MDESRESNKANQPVPPSLAESVAAVRAAYADLQHGETGRSAVSALRETCKRLGLVLEN
jgi:hypothetical protein